jgi:hypothetical protein
MPNGVGSGPGGALTPRTLADVFARQLDLQVNHFGVGDPALLSQDEKVEYLNTNVMAIVHEACELHDETSWKPWAKDQFINGASIRHELVDIMHFMVNIALAVDMTADDFVEMYFAKAAVNAKRQAAGYESGTMKCPTCGRAQDEPD